MSELLMYCLLERPFVGVYIDITLLYGADDVPI